MSEHITLSLDEVQALSFQVPSALHRGKDRHHFPLWRGSSLPLGRIAAPNPATRFLQAHRIRRLNDCFAAEREQAPSPHKHHLS